MAAIVTNDLAERIRKGFPDFTPSERSVATYLAKMPQDLAFLSAGKLAERAGVSEASVSRFARVLGYESYTTMQQEVQDSIRRQLSVSTTERFSHSFHNQDGGADLLSEMLRLECQNLDRTFQSITPAQIERITEMLVTAGTVYVLAQRGSAALGSHLAYTLGVLLPNVVSVIHHSDTLLEPMMKAKPGDVVLGVTFSRPSRRTENALDLAKSRGASLVVMTDTILSPAAALANEVLLIHSESLTFIQSYTAGMTVCNTLLAAVGRRTPAEVERRLQEWEQVIRQYDVLHQS